MSSAQSIPKLWSALRSLLRNPTGTRLDAGIEEMRGAIGRAGERLAGESGGSELLIGRCRQQLADAEQARDAHRPFLAYGLLKDIRRELVVAMTDDERRAELAALIAESETAPDKLNAWRRDLAQRLLALAVSEAKGRAAAPGAEADSSALPTPSVAILQALMRNLDEAQQNRHHKLELVQRQVLWLCLLLAMTIGLLATLTLDRQLDWINESRLPGLCELLPGAITIGFFGGLLSLAYGLTNLETRSSIQDLRSSFATTLARPLIGAAVSVPILLFLKSGLIAADAVTPVVTLSLCFIGGFSERWFLAQVDRISGGK